MALQFSTAKVSVPSATGTLIVSARPGRQELRLLGSQATYFGPDSGVSGSNGYPLFGLSSSTEKTLNVESAVYAWYAGGTGTTVYAVEIYDDAV